MRASFQLFCLVVLFPLVLVSPAKAQRRQSPRSTTIPSLTVIKNGTIYVQVFPTSGTIFASRPSVVLRQDGFDGPEISVPEEIGQNVWKFQGLQGGTEYVVQVEAKGYLPHQEYVELANTNNATAHVRIYLIPNGRPEDTFSKPPGHFLLSPRAQREVEKAIKDLKSSKASNARKHLEKALKMAPSHPGVNYLMGMSYLEDHQTSLAIPYLEKSISIDPSELPAVLALATVRYQQRDYSAAIDLLKNAAGKGPASWHVQWILAACYLHRKEYEQARRHAEASLKADKKKARRVRLVLGEALAGLGLRQRAIKELTTFLRENPRDPEAARVRAILEMLREPALARPKARAASEPAKLAARNTAGPASGGKREVKAAARTTPPAIAPLVPPAPAPAVAPKENWAPPDVDALKPRILSGRACPLPSLLKRAGRTSVEWVKDLQEFTATEEYQSVEIGHHGKVGKPFEWRFDYLVFIHKPRPHILDVEELRRPHLDLRKMGAPIVALGSPALALVFHPAYAHDYAWSCQGLGEWNGKPAWIVRFAQRSDRPTTALQSFVDGNGGHLLAIKGMAWLSEKGDHVMHLETDLMNPMPSLRLERQHFSINYKQVAFRSHPVKLWLPESVDFYVMFQGRAYHNYCHYSNFQLFWTGVAQKIGSVKQDDRHR